ncbi:Alpha/Beta hydrolase protein [Immersiella caudata]|uniref:Alpha/Beta hydrolase protein n=1 Tax=Immersiella caudata TaxID=314043 RepID=A0AA40CCN0_9PEZI|nr:Alpha/Beta hydrolase protein [Immersiella caudata]
MGKGYFRSLRRRVKARLFHHDASDPGRAASEATDHTSAAIQASSYGVLVWHDCPHATVDICFVHGLTGDRERSWTAADSKKEKDGHPWPQSILPPELPNARILTYGYDAYYTSEGVSSGNRLSDHARNLVTELTTNRRANQNRPLIFVAHSLGGLVTKKGLLLSRDNREEYLQGIFKCTKGIIFMGTPHRGSWMADWAKFPVSAFGVVKSVNGRLLKSLQTDGEYLESMQEDFARLLRKTDTKSETPIEVTCFFEELPMQVIGTIVSRESATLPDYNAISIHANHREMVRFSSTTDRGFVEVLGLLRKWQYEVE